MALKRALNDLVETQVRNIVLWANHAIEHRAWNMLRDSVGDLCRTDDFPADGTWVSDTFSLEVQERIGQAAEKQRTTGFKGYMKYSWL